MGWLNGTLIDQTNLQNRLDSCTKDGSGGTDVSSQRLVGNGFTVVRFKQSNLELGEEYRFRFISPDDFDIFMAGLDVRFQSTPTGGMPFIEFTAEIRGSTGDLENDLPVDDHLFLTEPVSNIQNQVTLAGSGDTIENMMYIKASQPGTQHQFGTRYSGYLLNENRACNTILKGSSYDVVMKVRQDPATITPNGEKHTLDFYLMLQTKLRRN
jgi:hypothetical protein